MLACWLWILLGLFHDAMLFYIWLIMFLLMLVIVKIVFIIAVISILSALSFRCIRLKQRHVCQIENNTYPVCYRALLDSSCCFHLDYVSYNLCLGFGLSLCRVPFGLPVTNTHDLNCHVA